MTSMLEKFLVNVKDSRALRIDSVLDLNFLIRVLYTYTIKIRLTLFYYSLLELGISDMHAWQRYRPIRCSIQISSHGSYTHMIRIKLTLIVLLFSSQNLFSSGLPSQGGALHLVSAKTFCIPSSLFSNRIYTLSRSSSLTRCDTIFRGSI